MIDQAAPAIPCVMARETPNVSRHESDLILGCIGDDRAVWAMANDRVNATLYLRSFAALQIVNGSGRPLPTADSCASSGDQFAHSLGAGLPSTVRTVPTDGPRSYATHRGRAIIGVAVE